MEVCLQCNNETYDMRLRNVVLCQACTSKYETLCKKCGERTDVYAEGTTTCPTCFYGDDFMIDMQERTFVPSNTCETCGKVEHLNANKQCKNCYVEENMAKAQGDDWGNTAVCQNCRKITKRGRKYCITCELKAKKVKTCKGCMQKFAMVSKYDDFCIPCKEHMNRGVCTMCGRMEMMGNDRGWCKTCVEEEIDERGPA